MYRTPRQSSALALALLLAAYVGNAGERAPHARLELIAQDAIEVGRVSYEQIARAFYGDRLDEIMTAKSAWRAAHPDQPWASDYDLFLKVAVGVELERQRRTRPGNGVFARYTLETNTARIPRENAGAMLAHEVAHGLTRRSIRTARQLAHIDDRLALDAAPPRGAYARQSGFHLEWLSYVTTQAEFEVRLQALNRYHFEMTGRAIDSPAEALRAVASLGVRLRADEVTGVLSSIGVDDPAAVSRAVSATPSRAWMALPACFRNADDLRKALQMAAAWNPDMHRTLLEKIAVEGPGHF